MVLENLLFAVRVSIYNRCVVRVTTDVDFQIINRHAVVHIFLRDAQLHQATFGLVVLCPCLIPSVPLELHVPAHRFRLQFRFLYGVFCAEVADVQVFLDEYERIVPFRKTLLVVLFPYRHQSAFVIAYRVFMQDGEDLVVAVAVVESNALPLAVGKGYVALYIAPVPCVAHVPGLALEGFAHIRRSSAVPVVCKHHGGWVLWLPLAAPAVITVARAPELQPRCRLFRLRHPLMVFLVVCHNVEMGKPFRGDVSLLGDAFLCTPCHKAMGVVGIYQQRMPLVQVLHTMVCVSPADADEEVAQFFRTGYSPCPQTVVTQVLVQSAARLFGFQCHPQHPLHKGRCLVVHHHPFQ